MTKFETKGNSNYAAEIIQVKNLVDLPGLDNLVGIPWSGYTALVSRSTQVGDVLVMFPAESQLSGAFAARNNLFRHSDLNADPEHTGYLEDNRRVRAIRLRGHASNALALDASVVGATVDDVGIAFDTVNGETIVQKYELPVRGGLTQKGQKTSVFAKVNLPEHFDTENYFRNSDKIGPDEFVTVTQKLHGTSVRYGRVPVPRELSRWQRVLRRLGAKVQDTEYAFVVGSRKVIKSVVRASATTTNENASHFYATDLWSQEGQKYADLIPEGVVVFGELIGWAGESPIQAGYTYNVPRGQTHFYLYRVAISAPDGKLYDLSWNGVKQFAFERGWNVVPELWNGFHEDFFADDWTDVRYADVVKKNGYDEVIGSLYPAALPLSDKKTVDEGVVVRRDGIVPLALKAKSPVFFGHETNLLDKEVVDLESAG